jgi:hypothetical protein
VSIDTRTKLEVLSALIAAAVIWHFATPKVQPIGVWHQATPAPEVEKIGTEATKPVKVIFYKPAAKKALGLSSAAQADAAQHVQTATKLPINDHPTELVTILDTDTGKTEVVVRNMPLPLLAAEQHGSIGVGYGITNGLMRGWALNAHEDLVQVKALHFGVDGSLFAGGAYFAGVGVAYRW